ncbi:MAG: MBL fold metallo-hydrolase [Bacilli bacterium]|nr:MBL fold metallo-hydrolase [Bacilli bacterium]
MKVARLVYGNDAPNFSANSYVICNDDSKCVVVDPSANNTRLVKFLKQNNLIPVAVLLTHGHFDHIWGLPILLDKYQIPVYIHDLDKELLVNPRDNCSWFENKQLSLEIEVESVVDGEHLHLLNNIDIEVIHTPFHTEGSVCYYLKDNKTLFSGDTLFKMSIGREDLPTSCPRYRNTSLAKLRKLPDDVKVYPGHGDITVLGKEKELNTLFQN